MWPRLVCTILIRRWLPDQEWIKGVAAALS